MSNDDTQAVIAGIFLALALVWLIGVSTAIVFNWGDGNPSCRLTDDAGVEAILENGHHLDYREGAWYLDGRLAAFGPSEDTVINICVGVDLDAVQR